MRLPFLIFLTTMLLTISHSSFAQKHQKIDDSLMKVGGMFWDTYNYPLPFESSFSTKLDDIKWNIKNEKYYANHGLASKEFTPYNSAFINTIQKRNKYLR